MGRSPLDKTDLVLIHFWNPNMCLLLHRGWTLFHLSLSKNQGPLPKEVNSSIKGLQTDCACAHTPLQNIKQLIPHVWFWIVAGVQAMELSVCVEKNPHRRTQSGVWMFFTRKGSGQDSNWEVAAGLQQCREPRTLTAWFSETRCFCETLDLYGLNPLIHPTPTIR